MTSSTTFDQASRLAGPSGFLSRERARIEGAHRAGASGAAVVRMLSDMTDRLVADVARTGLAALGKDADGAAAACGWAVVALGGYGRHELAPFSDVDLMVLHDDRSREEAEELARVTFRTLWDVKLRLGHSVRTVADCLEVAGRDLATRTSLLEGRLLLGDADVFARLEERLRSRVGGRGDALVRVLVDEMNRGLEKHGSSVYMLEPNVKKSGGGLRTIHFLRWIALARHGSADLGVLHARGLLTAQEGRAIREAQEFYWRIRNEMHFAAGRPADTLTLDEQLRLARFLGYQDEDGRLGVERFMQRYYLHATEVHETVERFIARTKEKPAWRRAAARALARRVDGVFVVRPDEISVTGRGREQVLSDPLRLYTLFHLAQVHGRKIDPELLDQIRSALEVQDDSAFRTPPVIRRFLEILSRPGRIAETVSLMHRTGALAKLLPEFAAVNRLVQFNRYHKYTVDEHTLAVLRGAEGFLRDGGVIGRAYRQIKRLDVLHLAILLHDVGKGRGGDHSAAGAEIAAAVARRFGYDAQDTRVLVFLVREHLRMEKAAFRRDINDEKVAVGFARVVGNPETLRMLFVLSCADIAGVGPGNWTDWKAELLTGLYVRTLDTLTGGRELPAPGERVADVKREVVERLAGRFDRDWLQAQLDAATSRYLLVTPPEAIARHLEWIAELAPNDVLVRAANDEGTGTTVYTVLTFDAPGLFSGIAGVLAAKGLQVLRAQVETRSNGIVVDTFDVADTFYAGTPPPERLAEVSGAIREVLQGRLTVEELFARHRRFRAAAGAPAPLERTKVGVDNDSSDRFTVVDVFAQDKQGLLYVIAKGLADLGLSVHSSKVATRLDQALDVFYVTDAAGARVTDPERIAEIERTLVERIETYEREG